MFVRSARTVVWSVKQRTDLGASHAGHSFFSLVFSVSFQLFVPGISAIKFPPVKSINFGIIKLSTHFQPVKSKLIDGIICFTVAHVDSVLFLLVLLFTRIGLPLGIVGTAHCLHAFSRLKSTFTD